MPKARPEPFAELPTPITPELDELPDVIEDGLVPPAGIDDDPESGRVVNIPD